MASQKTGPAGRWAVGVDLGGTKLKVAGVDARGDLFQVRQVETQAGDPMRVIEQIVELAREVVAEAGDGPPVGVGVGVAGQVTAATGAVHFAPNLRWHRVPLQAELAERLRLPVRVVNDVRAATFGEWTFGAGRGSQDLVCLFLGTGIGGGIVSGGRLLAGSSNSAGELGHQTVELNGPVCTCGNRGCLEALAGGWAIERDARQAASAQPLSARALLERSGDDPGKITARMVIEAYHEGDQLAGRIVSRALAALEAALVSMVNGFNPERILFGGGIMAGLHEEILNLESKVKKRALGIATANLRFLPGELLNDAPTVGAAAFVLREMAAGNSEK